MYNTQPDIAFEYGIGIVGWCETNWKLYNFSNFFCNYFVEFQVVLLPRKLLTCCYAINIGYLLGGRCAMFVSTFYMKCLIHFSKSTNMYLKWIYYRKSIYVFHHNFWSYFQCIFSTPIRRSSTPIEEVHRFELWLIQY